MQSDFVIRAEPPAIETLEGVPAAEVVELPRATLRSNEASARSTRIVMTFTWVMLVVLGLICAIGPHIPSGE